ncbi:precorrin-6A reductase [Chitinispirillales bacterium ANBcel5]|uniref:precorrin-6A reductase n=1 Tax=Cellulosispirillum alkaliphilum TaxID=3039283 RepID=UPI002A516CD8|nr:precorrin-6A reductase [Chitinispirillales bacterium ANBcel5]
MATEQIMNRSVLVVGGVAETESIVTGLEEVGANVVLCTATDEVFPTLHNSAAVRISGRLNTEGFVALIKEQHPVCVVDITHPYATEVKSTLTEACGMCGVKLIRYVRPATTVKEATDIMVVSSHEEAASLAKGLSGTVLLTTGANTVALYASVFIQKGIPFYARVLSRKESVDACSKAGLSEKQIVTGRGPFSAEENRRLITELGIETLVTKDGGVSGGLPEKVSACRACGAKLIVVERPQEPRGSFSEIEEVIDAVFKVMGR